MKAWRSLCVVVLRALVTCFLAGASCCSAADAQAASAPSGLTSPDGRWELIWQKRSDYDYSLNLSNLKTHESREVLSQSQPQTAGWAPNGEWFFVNEHESSDWDNAYVYNAATLERFDLAQLITSHDLRYEITGLRAATCTPWQKNGSTRSQCKLASRVTRIRPRTSFQLGSPSRCRLRSRECAEDAEFQT